MRATSASGAAQPNVSAGCTHDLPLTSWIEAVVRVARVRSVSPTGSSLLHLLSIRPGRIEKANIRSAQACFAALNVDRGSIAEALADKSRTAEERSQLAQSAASLGYREVWPELVRLVADEDPLLSFAASGAIVTLKARAASRALMKLAQVSFDGHAGRAAIDALWWLRERRAANLLSRLVTDKGIVTKFATGQPRRLAVVLTNPFMRAVWFWRLRIRVS